MNVAIKDVELEGGKLLQVRSHCLVLPCDLIRSQCPAVIESAALFQQGCLRWAAFGECVTFKLYSSNRAFESVLAGGCWKGP
jgi:hypothetical protein